MSIFNRPRASAEPAGPRQRVRAKQLQQATYEIRDADGECETGPESERHYFDVMSRWLPIVLVFVLGLSFVLLTLAFRSVVVAATAIALNLLSVGAAYGLLVLVLQKGVGSGLLGFQQVDVIESALCSCPQR
jgi:uncharacterized membrane protein YdfJ with MMPL/SSD domain